MFLLHESCSTVTVILFILFILVFHTILAILFVHVFSVSCSLCG